MVGSPQLVRLFLGWVLDHPGHPNIPDVLDCAGCTEKEQKVDQVSWVSIQQDQAQAGAGQSKTEKLSLRQEGAGSQRAGLPASQGRFTSLEGILVKASQRSACFLKEESSTRLLSRIQDLTSSLQKAGHSSDPSIT